MIAIPALAADGCTQTSEPIETDRPDVTNSSVVIPVVPVPGCRPERMQLSASAFSLIYSFLGRWRLAAVGLPPA